jgi:hypothetical protein
MFQKYFFIGNYLLIILVGILYWYKLKQSLPLKLFMWFLVYSLITEIVGTYFAFYAKINTALIYNTWNLISYLFYSYLFLVIIKNKTKRKVIFYLTLTYLIYELVNTLFYQNYLTDVYAYSTILIKIFLVITILMYFLELLKSDLILNVKESMFFWISLGVLIYSIGFIPVFVIAKLIDYQGIFRHITFALNISVSLCFITGFIVSKKEYNV